MGSWPDPWDELAYFQEELLGILDDKLGDISKWAEDIWWTLYNYIGNALKGMQQYIEGLADDIGGYIGDVLNDLIEGLDWILDGIMEPVISAINYVGDAMLGIGEWIYDGISDGLATVDGWISGTWDSVKGFLSNQYDKITTFWGDIFSDLYFYLDLALTDIWIYFVDVVIPVFMDALSYVFESEPVKWLVSLFEEHTLSMFGTLLDIDEEALQKWIQKSFAYMRYLAEGVKE